MILHFTRMILKNTLRPNYFIIICTWRALCRCALTIVKPDVKSRSCGRDWEEKKERTVTQRDAGAREDSEERGTRNEIHSACAWKLLAYLLDQVDCPLDPPHTFDGNRSTEQRRRANGRRLIRINAVARHSRYHSSAGITGCSAKNSIYPDWSVIGLFSLSKSSNTIDKKWSAARKLTLKLK